MIEAGWLQPVAFPVRSQHRPLTLTNRPEFRLERAHYSSVRATEEGTRRRRPSGRAQLAASLRKRTPSRAIALAKYTLSCALDRVFTEGRT